MVVGRVVVAHLSNQNAWQSNFNLTGAHANTVGASRLFFLLPVLPSKRHILCYYYCCINKYTNRGCICKYVDGSIIL